MDNEEKKVKKTTKATTPKKSTTKTASTKKVTEKKETTKKAAPKKETVKEEVKVVKKTTKVVPKKTVSKKETVKKEPVKKVEQKAEKKVVKKAVPKTEVKIVEPVKEEVKVEKIITKEIKEEKVSKKELKAIRKKRYIIEGIIIAVVVIIGLILLCNRTFLSINYKTDKLNVSIPRFSYFVSDEDNEVKFLTLRKSDYLKEYYNEYLEGFTFYSCDEGRKTFYYNEKTKTLIEEIEVEKKFAIKVIEISYDSRTPEEVCGIR